MNSRVPNCVSPVGNVEILHIDSTLNYTESISLTCYSAHARVMWLREHKAGTELAPYRLGRPVEPQPAGTTPSSAVACSYCARWLPAMTQAPFSSFPSIPVVSRLSKRLRKPCLLITRLAKSSPPSSSEILALHRYLAEDLYCSIQC
ncbi:hypothetical protein E2C01_072702 [Portunus trituberculatus]|uniref:Uncharacterized protein n=1 Tax=Portunus trituberculatus TaxID=210409 RepID=A0A5B7I8J8_PORTR|nr:hypothetical protein [Portunus trituberculatus]